jgi:alkaline phosphatase D
MKKLTSVLSCLLFVVTIYSQEIKVNPKYANTARKFDNHQVLQTIALGSCNNQSKSQEMWNYVVKNKPELWIWLGDNIYADTKNAKVMADKYSTLKNDINYRKLLACSMVVGTWDDHDFGANDAGKEFPMKRKSKKLMLDFLDVPKNASVRHREGAYQSFTFGKAGKKVKIILLDARYFRDQLKKRYGMGAKYHIKKLNGLG